MPLDVVTPPSALPVDLTELKDHLRLGGSAPQQYTREDNVLELMVQAASNAYQERFKVQLLDATLRWHFKEFKNVMELPRLPFKSVESVKYVDSDGELQTIPQADYSEFAFTNQPGRVAFSKEYEFPDLNEINPYPVHVEYISGYGVDYTKVPEETRQYLMNIIGTYYMQRESRVISYTGSISVQEMSKEMSFLLQGTPKPMRFG